MGGPAKVLLLGAARYGLEQPRPARGALAVSAWLSGEGQTVWFKRSQPAGTARATESSGDPVALPAGDARTAPEYFEPEVVQRRSELAAALQRVLETGGNEQAVLAADVAGSRLTEALYGRWM